MIEVDGLTKDYGKRRAIDNISFTAEKGEVVGFLDQMEPEKQQPCGSFQVTCLRQVVLLESGDLTSFKNSLDVRRLVGYLPGNSTFI